MLAAAGSLEARADKSTVCTITVNSPDEREMFRRSLPDDQFQFVELVERGRPDWLASACRRGIRCDLLVISGHFDAGTEFYSDRLDAREFLPVEEMERVSCSDSCPGLFSQLKEVYLFGCNTLNAATVESTAAEVARSLVRSGHSPADAGRLAQALNERHNESNRDGMRRIFLNVPVIYGFSALAPLGPTAATILGRYFQSTPAAEVGTGRASPRLVSHFAVNSMTVTSGLGDSDPRAGYRREVCQFFDERLSPAQKLGFVHELLSREMAEVRMFFERIEKLLASLPDDAHRTPPVAGVLGEIARDEAARDRYLAFARDVDRPPIRVRMMNVARTLGWLSPADERAETVRMIGNLLAGDALNPADMNLVCALNKDGALDREFSRFELSPRQAHEVTHAAALACLGSVAGRARVLEALVGANEDEVGIAQVYFHHRPLADDGELRLVATGIARMTGAEAQVRALDTLARQYVADRESLDTLTGLFPRARSVNVQRAIAGVLIRADYRAIAKPELARMLRQHRLKSPDGADLIDVLIRRLQA
ncbi:MAG: hypothetical protein ABI886_08880 [Betaproteobacteria bacterium]